VTPVASAPNAQSAQGGRDVEGLTAVVTGAARGIGRVIAIALAAAGADVVACARQPAAVAPVCADIEALGRRALAVPVDLRDPAQIDRIPDLVLSHFGKIDVLVNNGGQAGPSGPLWELPPDEWRETLDVNLTGAYLCSRAVLPSMIERRSGSIVFIGSVTGKRPLMHRSAYAASKLG
jgi:NAD(P)-dependent dehydrogenase (short-subunit alcohol dehydrogenase family)